MTIKLKFDRNVPRRISLKHIKVRLINECEDDKWNELMSEHHYLGNARIGGNKLRYIAECRGKCLALISFSSCSYHLSSRDNYIGWSYEQLEMRRHFVIQNSRFLILPDINKKNLASRILGLCVGIIAEDWQKHFRYKPLLAETFVDPMYTGTGYRASGWIRLGETKGFSRDANGFYVSNGTPKTLFIKELSVDACKILSAVELPEEIKKYEKKLPVRCLTRKLKVENINSLFESLRTLEDIRKGKQGTRHRLSSCLAIIVAGVVSGCHGLEECAEFGKSLSVPQKRALHVWIHPKKNKYIAPSHTTLWRAVNLVDPVNFENVVFGWYNMHSDTLPDAISLDGKTLRATINENQEGSHIVSAFPHSVKENSFFLNKPV